MYLCCVMVVWMCVDLWLVSICNIHQHIMEILIIDIDAWDGLFV